MHLIIYSSGSVKTLSRHMTMILRNPAAAIATITTTADITTITTTTRIISTITCRQSPTTKKHFPIRKK